MSPSKQAVQTPNTVVVNEFGDTIQAHGQRSADTPVDGSYHTTCAASVQVFPSSATHNALICNGRCRLRVPIPVEASTIADLRKHFQRFNQ